jgi:endoglycosylceramidase
VLWNYENFSMVDAAGNERVMLDAWVRPWLRAVSGQSPQFAWDAALELGSASWTAEDGVTQIAMPRRLFGDAGPSSLEITGEGACFTIDMQRSEVRVIANPGASVTVEFAR